MEQNKILKEDLINYYYSHSRKDTAIHFNISERQLIRLLSSYNIKKPKDKIIKVSNNRSHDSYIAGGKKSAQTQKEHWAAKTIEEKQAWAEKQKIAHNTESFKTKISQINKAYQKNLPIDKKAECNHKRSVACKTWWYSNFSEAERKEWIKTSLANGAGWNHKKIKGSNSRPNLFFKEKLVENNLYISDDENREFILGSYSYDFKVGNNLIEINPSATHNSTWGIFNRDGLSKDYHYNKSKLAEANGYKCIHIWDWDNIDKVITLLLPRKTLYARKCYLGLVDYNKAHNFIEQYHLQGDTKKNKTDIRVGLFYGDELVSVMTFGKPRYNKNYAYELLRYCSSNNVIGGAEKLFKYFIKLYDPDSIISYCDLSKFTGNTYIKLGFIEKSCSISKHWYNMTTNQHITDNLLRQRGFDQLFGTNYGKGISNEELMVEHNFIEIYDAGQVVYSYLKDSD